ncbi:MAG: M20/M25/M40 family metallo-hydrolase [Planctomycetota bacterium]|nr:M20/M25/M40 family metallo-hydrolase [Planctomycetota bacterium]MDA1213343.1 M20/M25/M40 family metallo-hydrolase [Planctomycetota bacterium]
MATFFSIRRHVLLSSFVVFSLATVGFSSIALAADNQTEKHLPHWKGEIDEDQVRNHIEFLAGDQLKGRSGPSARVAAKYITYHFEKCGLQPLFTDANNSGAATFEQPIPGGRGEDGSSTIIGYNLGGWIPGSDPQLRDEIIIISAHYDHLGKRNGVVFPGADDNASGVSMVLSVAKQISELKTRPKRSIVFIAFDLEEHMLWGSRWFAAHTPWPIEQVKLFITADMIGRSIGNLPLPCVFVMGSEHGTGLDESIDTIGHPEGLEVARLGIDLIGSLPRSDYGPFRDREIPFLFFSTGEHPDYHSRRDTPERIDYGKVARVSSLVNRLTQHIAEQETSPEWIGETSPNMREVYTLRRITGILIQQEEAEEYPLTNAQKLMISQAHNKAGQIIEQGTFDETERSWLIRTAQLMLLSLF